MCRRRSRPVLGSAAVTEIDLEVADGRTLHAYDTAPGDAGDRLAVFWHHGTPNIGAPPEPLFPAAARFGIRWVSYDRPGYGGSIPDPGRDVASAAGDVAAIADAFGIERFGVVGHSGGGPHALACAALLPDRVVAAVSVAGPAPFGADDLDWFEGMAPSGQAALRAAVEGRTAKEAYEASGADDQLEFTPADTAALTGEWGWLLDVVRPALAAGPGGLIDDDLAIVAPWGFDPSLATIPALLLHGGRDRVVPSSHSEWLARTWPRSELRLSPDDGHISILGSAPAAIEWLQALAR
jgi:pimeloyl-ACP methyl ester carboxylesterase